ncbi:MAG TPA: methylenetetrahydrofolate reductase [Armatimonadota bacterium]|nr:methylenetetrahydrofolate reductase [Armatimonadota bacterium]
MAGSKLAEAIKGGKFVITAECRPPRGAGADMFKSCVDALGSSVTAISAPESEDGVRQCSLAACGHLIAASAEPILHLLTRDMNRIALQASILGAASMGIKNILCTSGRHQALTTSATAKGVFDIDPIQLLRIADAMRKDGRLADGQTIDAPIDLLLGTDANPFAEPVELHLVTLKRAVASGADFIVTAPVFDLAKFESWMAEVRKLQQKPCIIASVLAAIPEDVADKFKYYAPGPGADEIISGLRKIDGVRGIYLMAGDDFEGAKKLLG